MSEIFDDILEVELEEVAPSGYSAYEVWLIEGNEGSIDDFLAYLVGPPGYTPIKNTDYFDGLSAYEVWLIEGNEGTVQDFLASLEGKSAYDLWAEKNEGSIDDFLAYLVGPPGYTPVKGVDYRDGVDGYTPVKGVDYRDGVDGYTPVKGTDYFDGTDADIWTIGSDNYWYKNGVKTDNKAKGDKGDEGYTPIKGVDYNDGYTPIKNTDYFDGLSAYEIWLSEGNTGDEQTFLDSLKADMTRIEDVEDEIGDISRILTYINTGEGLNDN